MGSDNSEWPDWRVHDGPGDILGKKLPVFSRRHPGQLAEVGIKAGEVSVAGISGSVENAGSGLQSLLSGSDSHLDQVFCRLHVIVKLED